MRLRHGLGVVLLVALLGSSVVGIGSAIGESFFTEGEVRQSEAANSFGKTVANYLIGWGLPLMAVGSIAGGGLRLKERPGQGWAGIGTGVGLGYVAQLVRANHDPAVAADGLSQSLAGMSWETWAVSLILQAAFVAVVICAVRSRHRVETLS